MKNMIDYLPGGIRQHLIIEVYLPKNLLNHGALIELLTETMEFNCAQNWLRDKCEEIYNNDSFLFEIHQKYEKHLREGNVSEMKRLFKLHGYPLTGKASFPHEKNIYWVKIKKTSFQCGSNDFS